ncbi:MAG: hypothetical protein ISR55_03510 [Bacteroidetes bacterium]|nr:hypothetical protein [Bacteroidota bacterium]
MKLFFKRILIFFGFIILFYSSLEIWSRKVFLTETDLHLKFSSLEKVKDSIEILAIGNSHLEKGLNPSFFNKKAFNLAYSAQDLYYDNQLYKHYIEEMPQLKYLIIGVDFLSFGYDESKNSMYYVRDYNKELNIRPRNGISYLYLLNHSIFWINRLKFIRYVFNGFPAKNKHSYSDAYLLPDVHRMEPVLMGSGYRATWSFMSESELIKDAMITSARGISLYNSSIENENIRYLSEVIGLAYRRNIRIFLLSAPVSSAYKNSFPEEMQSHFLSLINIIRMHYPEVSYINAMDHFIQRKEVFYNSDHLNEKGAAEFTPFLEELILNNQVISPYNYAD